MRTALLVITDGRGEYLEQAMASVPDYPFADVVIVDDSGDLEYRDWLWDTFNPDTLISHPSRQGLIAAIKSAWHYLDRDDIDYVFHLEEDFLVPDAPIEDMIRLLEADRWMAQVVLKRQPALTPEEQLARGFIELHPAAYLDCPGHLQHSRCFSFNPCVYPIRVTFGGADQESGVTKRLVSEGYHFGIYGGRHDKPRCQHIGVNRSAGWKL